MKYSMKKFLIILLLFGCKGNYKTKTVLPCRLSVLDSIMYLSRTHHLGVLDTFWVEGIPYNWVYHGSSYWLVTKSKFIDSLKISRDVLVVGDDKKDTIKIYPIDGWEENADKLIVDDIGDSILHPSKDANKKLASMLAKRFGKTEMCICPNSGMNYIISGQKDVDDWVKHTDEIISLKPDSVIMTNPKNDNGVVDDTILKVSKVYFTNLSDPHIAYIKCEKCLYGIQYIDLPKESDWMPIEIYGKTYDFSNDTTKRYLRIKGDTNIWIWK